MYIRGISNCAAQLKHHLIQLKTRLPNGAAGNCLSVECGAFEHQTN